MKFVVALLLCSFMLSSCHAQFQWSDCGTPLTRWVSYESVTLSPANSISISQQLSINVLAIVSQGTLPLDTIDTQLTVLKDGAVFLNATTRDLCDILGANNQSCILEEGQKISYTYQLDFPSIPRGNYSVRIVSTSSLLQQEVGCMEVQAAVEGLTTPNKCTWESTFAASITGTLDFAKNKFNQTVGDFIQVGPWGRNAGSGKNLLPWGRFTSITGSVDVVGSGKVDAVNYVWGINGTLMSMTNTSGTQTHTYTGTVVVGYLENGNVTGKIEFVYGGNFEWLFLSDPSANTYSLSSNSRLALASKYFHPIGFPYPLVVGNLNPLTLNAISVSTSNTLATSLSAATTWCTCGDDCSVLGSAALVKTQISGSSDKSLSLLRDGAIAIGVVGGIAIIMAVIFFAVHYKTSKRPVFDPAEMVYPAKPDYGSMALGEIIDEEVHDHV